MFEFDIVNTSEPLEFETKEYNQPPILDGTRDYDELSNKPKINGITLEGNKSSEEIGIEEISNFELEELLK